MSTLVALGELSPAALAQRILTLPPFQSFSQDDFRQVLRHWIELDHIQRTHENGLIVGLAAERLVKNFKFYAIFPDNEEYAVWSDGIELGTVVVPPDVGDRLSLAGRIWEVTEVNSRRKVLQVKPAIGTSSVSWRGSSGNIHTRVLQRMRQALLEDTEYPYLQSGAKARLAEARKLAKKEGLESSYLFPLEGNACCILPWAGTIAVRTLERFLRLHCRETLKIKGVMGRSPYFLIVNMGKCSTVSLYHEIKSLSDRRMSADELLAEEEAPKLQKYDEFIPPVLLRRAFAADYLDLEALGSVVSNW